MHHLWDMLRASYDRSAARYDAELADEQAIKFAALLAGRAAPLAAALAAPGLDLGCGTGLLAEALRREGLPARMVGLDLSPGMLRASAGRLTLAVEGLAEALPFADASFGLVAAVTVLGILDAPLGPTLHEIDRVLRPGGWLLASILRGRDDGALARWLREAGYAVEGPLPAGQDQGWVARKR